MKPKFSMNSQFFNQSFIDMIVDKFRHMGNPEVGKKMMSISRPNFAVRFDGRTPEELAQAKGFKARIPMESIKSIRHDCVERYQKYNIDPFGIGTCLSYPDLAKGYGADNRHLSLSKTLYGFLAPSVSMTEMRQDILGEPGDRDYEQEYVVMMDVPIEDFIYATTPSYREAFEAGIRVPNEMATFNLELHLPKSFNKDDVKDLASVFKWLLNHNAEKAAKVLCSFVFANASEKQLLHRLHGDKSLVSAAQLFLKDKTDEVPQGPTLSP